MNTDESGRLELLRRIEWFRTLTDAQLRQISAQVQEQRFAAGTPIFEQEEPGECLYLIVTGYIRIYLLNADGREITLRVYGPGKTVGEFAVFDSKPRSTGAMATSDVTTLTICRREFYRLLEGNFDLVRRIIEDLTERLRYTTTYSQNLAFLSATGRIATALVSLAEPDAHAPGPVALNVTQHELATYANATREWTNKALRTFAAEGLLQVGRGVIEIHELEQLRHWAEV